MNNYNLTLKIRNAHALEQMRKCGYKTPMEAAKELGIGMKAVYDIVNLTAPMYAKDGVSIRPAVKKFAKLLGCLPEELYPESHIHTALKVNSWEAEVNAEQLMKISQSPDPFKAVEQLQDAKALSKITEYLTDKEKEVIKLYYQDELSEKQISDIFYVSIARIHQIREKALHKLRSPNNVKHISKVAGHHGDEIKVMEDIRQKIS